MSRPLISLIALGLVLAAGIGGALGAVALGAGDLATPILAFAAGLLAGLASPQLSLSAAPPSEP